MDTLRRHRTPRWLNARLRFARLTVPQWLALFATGAAGLGLSLWLSGFPLPHTWGLIAFYLRLAIVGPLTGLLGVLLYAVADDRREPVIRQALFYLLRRHHYDEGAPHASIQASQPIQRPTHTRRSR